MKRAFLFVITIFFSHLVFAQNNNRITIGRFDSVQSQILGEQRKVWVYVPNADIPDHDAGETKYPVVYLLDGDAHFYSVVGMIQQLSQVNGNSICPEMIVVGIPNTDRTRDLTPTHVDADSPMVQSAFLKSSGGGEKFIYFIEKELIPHIDSTYPTAPYKTFIGHSLGGLTVINTLVNHTSLFNSYIAIDPSMWWDRQQYIVTAKKKLAEENFAGKSLYIGIANTMDEGMSIDKVKKDTAYPTRHIRAILGLDAFIKSGKAKGLNYQSKYYSNDDHISAPLITTYDGLRFIFEKTRLKFFERDYTDSSDALAGKIESHYNMLSRFFGYKVLPREDLVDFFSHTALSMKHYAKTARLLQMNLNNYPASPAVWASYADYLAVINNKPEAIEYYKKSLAIKEDAATRKKLDDLLK